MSSRSAPPSGRIPTRYWVGLFAVVMLCETTRNLFMANRRMAASTAATTPCSDQPRPAELSFPTTLDTVVDTLWSSISNTSPRRAEIIDSPQACGLPWNEFLDHVTFDSGTMGPLLWTVSGGDEYRFYSEMLLQQWERLESSTPMLVVALDEETAQHVCSLGYTAVYWNREAASYSRVGDAKFMASAEWAFRGIDALFAELDVFCRRSPFELFLDSAHEEADIVQVGHGDLQKKINIGIYFVRASERTGTFFRTLSTVLEPSVTDKGVVKKNGNGVCFFDQDTFQACLYKYEGWYRVSDKEYQHDLLSACNRHDLKHAMVSNVYISSHGPPNVFDSTYCIHPLDGRPFTPFRYKLATAKFLGFDPAPIRSDERLLKTLSGEIVYDDWKSGFVHKNFHAQEAAQKAFQRHIATLIKLALESGRTLVLPRHIRSQKQWTFPVYSLVDVGSLGKLVPNWRFMTTQESMELDDVTSVIPMPKDMESAVNATKSCTDKVCAIHGLYKTKYEPFASDEELEDIVSKLHWCFHLRGGLETLNFVPSMGGFERSCVGGPL